MMTRDEVNYNLHYQDEYVMYGEMYVTILAEYSDDDDDTVFVESKSGATFEVQNWELSELEI